MSGSRGVPGQGVGGACSPGCAWSQGVPALGVSAPGGCLVLGGACSWVVPGPRGWVPGLGGTCSGGCLVPGGGIQACRGRPPCEQND